jgi:hypothetical protein
MSQQTYAAVDRYIADLLVPADPALDAALAAAAAHRPPTTACTCSVMARPRASPAPPA